jgi:hypothetical protein
MRIKDIKVSEVRAGKNWRFVPPSGDAWLELPMEEWGDVQEADQFIETDTILYSALIAYPSGDVKPVVLLKEVGHADYWGDCCEFVDGEWRQIGLTPNPDAPTGREHVANPLEIDPSFSCSDDDYRKWHRDGFLTHSDALSRFA